MARGLRIAWLGILASVACAHAGSPMAGGATNRPAQYVPPPVPVDTGRYLVGAVMCPLWGDGSRWADIVPFPEREPLLGWYDEGNPEVTDWEIKWALDHGISFFLACWYRETGSVDELQVRPGLDHWIEAGLRESRYRDQFKFAIMWENANQAYHAPTNEKDFLEKLVPFWIETYFRRSDYLVLDGKPVFSIFNQDRFIKELGSEAAAAAALEKFRLACVEAGFAGIHLLGQYCWGGPEELDQQAGKVQRLGMDASWAYHWPTFTGVFGDNRQPDGQEAIAAQERLWRTQPQPNILTLSMGWDEAPWKFKYSKTQWRLSPAEFRTLAFKAKALLDERTGTDLSSRLVLLDNWNEFGEGHYILPTAEHGFGYLDAVRDVFAPGAPPHADQTPEQLGLGPYDSVYRAWLETHPTSNP